MMCIIPSASDVLAVCKHECIQYSYCEFPCEVAMDQTKPYKPEIHQSVFAPLLSPAVWSVKAQREMDGRHLAAAEERQRDAEERGGAQGEVGRRRSRLRFFEGKGTRHPKWGKGRVCCILHIVTYYVLWYSFEMSFSTSAKRPDFLPSMLVISGGSAALEVYTKRNRLQMSFAQSWWRSGVIFSGVSVGIHSEAIKVVLFLLFLLFWRFI